MPFSLHSHVTALQLIPISIFDCSSKHLANPLRVGRGGGAVSRNLNDLVRYIDMPRKGPAQIWCPPTAVYCVVAQGHSPPPQGTVFHNTITHHGNHNTITHHGNHNTITHHGNHNTITHHGNHLFQVKSNPGQISQYYVISTTTLLGTVYTCDFSRLPRSIVLQWNGCWILSQLYQKSTKTWKMFQVWTDL